jgi:hypothetical protein
MLHYCELCDKSFYSKYNLERHMKKPHCNPMENILKRKEFDSESDTESEGTESSSQGGKCLKRTRIDESDKDDSYTENDSDKSEDSDSDSLERDPQALSPEGVKMFQGIVYNGELGKVRVTKRLLLELLGNLKCDDSDSNDEEEDDGDDDTTDNDGEEEKNDTTRQSENYDDDILDREFNDLQLQVLRAVLRAADKRVYNLRKDNFIALVDCFVNNNIRN